MKSVHSLLSQELRYEQQSPQKKGGGSVRGGNGLEFLNTVYAAFYVLLQFS